MIEASADATLTAEAPAPVSCEWCGGTIGVYEPLVVFDDGVARESTPTNDFNLPLTARYYHRCCYQTL